MDDMAGETVLVACEKALFGSPESTAAALSYAASQITRLTALGDVTAANPMMTPELQALRRAVERDRYGLMGYALAARDHCTPSDCPAFRSLTDHTQISANMDQRVYEGMIIRYSPSWNAPPPSAALAALPPSTPTGKPTNAEFPTAASTPPVSIMVPEPGASSAPRQAAPAANAPLPRPTPSPTSAAAKKQVAPKTHVAPPTQIVPQAQAPAPESE